MTAGTSALLAVIGGGAAAVAVATKDDPQVAAAADRRPQATAPGVAPAAGTAPDAGLVPAPAAGRLALGDAQRAAGDAGLGDRLSTEADRTATRSPRRTAADGAGTAVPGPGTAPAAGAAPVITTQTQTETRPIPYQTRLVRDPSLPRGERRVRSEGVNGEETLRWLVTFTDGKPTDRRLLDTTVTRQPQHRVIAFGWSGRGHGWGEGHGHRRECGPGLSGCLPLGRSACPDQNQIEENAIQLGGSVTVLDEDLAGIDANDLDTLPADPAATCPENPAARR